MPSLYSSYALMTRKTARLYEAVLNYTRYTTKIPADKFDDNFVISLVRLHIDYSVFSHLRFLMSSCLYLELMLGDNVLLDELVGVLLQYDRLSVDLLVHDGLCEHRLIGLVVTVTSITHLSYTVPVLASIYTWTLFGHLVVSFGVVLLVYNCHTVSYVYVK